MYFFLKYSYLSCGQPGKSTHSYYLLLEYYIYVPCRGSHFHICDRTVRRSYPIPSHLTSSDLVWIWVWIWVWFRVWIWAWASSVLVNGVLKHTGPGTDPGLRYKGIPVSPIGNGVVDLKHVSRVYGIPGYNACRSVAAEETWEESRGKERRNGENEWNVAEKETWVLRRKGGGG